jgi:Holliday junction resolvase-like predicted endonuclease
MSNYSDGARFERATRHHLEENGYQVIRSAGSKGKVDLVAFKTGEILFVQNKINGLCAPAERTELRRLAGMVGALPIVAYRHKEGRAAATVRYRLLTGAGPKAFAGWTPDAVGPDQRSIRNDELVETARARRDRRLSEQLEAASSVTLSSEDVSSLARARILACVTTSDAGPTFNSAI